MASIKLPEEVAKHYELVDYPRGFGPGARWPQGEVNVSTLTVDEAERLVKRKWPFLRKRKSTPADAKKESDKK